MGIQTPLGQCRYIPTGRTSKERAESLRGERGRGKGEMEERERDRERREERERPRERSRKIKNNNQRLMSFPGT